MTGVSTKPIPDVDLVLYPELFVPALESVWASEEAPEPESTPSLPRSVGQAVELYVSTRPKKELAWSVYQGWYELGKGVQDSFRTLYGPPSGSLLNLASSSLWIEWIRANADDETSRPLIKPGDWERFRQYLAAAGKYAGIAVSPSLQHREPTRRQYFQPMSAGLLLWLETTGHLDDDE